MLPPLTQIAQLLEGFRSRPLTPGALYDLEQALLQRTRELTRQLLEDPLNQLEPEGAAQTPVRLCQDGNRYRRRDKHPNTVATLFGPLTVCRFLYEPYEAGERCRHPWSSASASSPAAPRRR